MTEQLNYCEHCGAKLVRGGNFCEACGRPVQTQAVPPPAQAPAQRAARPPQAAYTTSPPPPAYTPPVNQPKGRSNTWLFVGACGCLTILCLALVVVGGIYYMRNYLPGEEISNLLPPEIVQPIEATEFPQPEPPIQNEQPPVQVEPTESIEILPPEPESVPQESVSPNWPADVGQQRTDTYFSDDFSTKTYDWANVMEQYDALVYEDGRYAISLQRDNYTVWAYLPVDFSPTSISFDAAIVPGAEQGAYGAMCYYQDEENYHFVSINPWNREYSIGYVEDDEYITLMRDMWMPSSFLSEQPYAVNSIQIVCDPDMITLFINNELEAQASATPLAAGEMAIFGETMDELSPNGFKVLFDNVIAFVPVQ